MYTNDTCASMKNIGAMCCKCVTSEIYSCTRIICSGENKLYSGTSTQEITYWLGFSKTKLEWDGIGLKKEWV